MPTPASEAIARIDGVASPDAITCVAAASSRSRLRVASARRDWASVKTDHAPVVVAWVTKRSVVRLGARFQTREGAIMAGRSSEMPTSSRAVRLESFGGPDVLSVREVPAPQAGPGQIRVRVAAAGLNPMDWFMTADAETASRFGLSLPCGFGTDYAGVVDQVGDGVAGFSIGDRVFGAALSRAVADHVVVELAGSIATGGDAHPTPDGVDDCTAATLAIAGCTASAALAVVDLRPDETVLIGGAGGGVGVFTVQLARLAGARVIGTGSATSSEYLRS